MNRPAILSIAYHNIIHSDAMPDKAQDKEYRGVEYRLLPGTREKARKLAGTAGACRFVWNYFLAKNKEKYEQAKKNGTKPPSVSFFSLGKEFTQLRKEINWLSDYSFKIVRHTLKYQSDAWQAFFNKNRNGPVFHSKHGKRPSFTIPENVKIRDGKLYIPKVGWMQLRRKGGNPYPDGKPIKATVKKVGRQWRVSVNYEIDPPKRTENGVTVGVDVGCYEIACTHSTGEQELLPVPQLTRKEIRVRRYQRKLARQQKGSNRSRVTKRKLAKQKRKQQSARKNADHQYSRRLSNKAQTLIREELDIPGMTGSAKGTVEKPGKHVRAKAALNEKILNANWGRFNRYCDYKFAETGEVRAHFTSQMCSRCGHTCKENRVTRTKFKCMACGHADHADLNASVNILASGIGATGRGEAFPLGTSMSRQIERSSVNYSL